MKIKTTYLHSVLFMMTVVLAAGCLDSYPPPKGKGAAGTLVVEALIDPVNGTGSVTLTRSVPLASAETPKAETRADVTLEDENGSSFKLQETESGIYTTSSEALSVDKKYRLNIRTSQNSIYQSDYIVSKRTPPIDTISYAVVKDGLEIRVSAHDPTGNSQYYRWRYTETWEYFSSYSSQYLIQSPGVVVDRPFNENIQHCWKTQSGLPTLLESTTRLNEDRVTNFPLLVIPGNSIKLSVKYSILVRQQALTEEAYNYWSTLQRITENLGGLYDPLPAELKGNISCITDPSESVIGFFSGGSIEEKRIFLNVRDLPGGLLRYNSPVCQIDTIEVADLRGTPTGTLLIGAIYNEEYTRVIAYTTAEDRCIDCRTYGGGVLIKPDFWD
jgi:hypothetical protein